MTEGDSETIVVLAEPVLHDRSAQLAHLAANRGLIVRRALLASAIRGFLPLPVADDVLCLRIHAGLFQKLASLRQVDLAADCAILLAKAGLPGTLRRLSVTAIAALVAKFAGRKFLALFAAGHSAQDMACSFLRASLFDHYCAMLHVGGPVLSTAARQLCDCMEVVSAGLSSGPILDAFRDGARQLGHSLLEAPAWVMHRTTSLGERFVQSRGNPDVLDAVPEVEQEHTWLDRAARAVDQALARAGADAIGKAIEIFEQRWRSSAAHGAGAADGGE
jgi:uncharacterized protein (DUF697 family)